MQIILELTDAQIEKLLETLWDTQDEGPVGMGWKSSELEGLIDIIESVIETVKNPPNELEC